MERDNVKTADSGDPLPSMTGFVFDELESLLTGDRSPSRTFNCDTLNNEAATKQD